MTILVLETTAWTPDGKASRLTISEMQIMGDWESRRVVSELSVDGAGEFIKKLREESPDAVGFAFAGFRSEIFGPIILSDCQRARLSHGLTVWLKGAGGDEGKRGKFCVMVNFDV